MYLSLLTKGTSFEYILNLCYNVEFSFLDYFIGCSLATCCNLYGNSIYIYMGDQSGKKQNLIKKKKKEQSGHQFFKPTIEYHQIFILKSPKQKIKMIENILLGDF